MDTYDSSCFILQFCYKMALPDARIDKSVLVCAPAQEQLL